MCGHDHTYKAQDQDDPNDPGDEYNGVAGLPGIGESQILLLCCGSRVAARPVLPVGVAGSLARALGRRVIAGRAWRSLASGRCEIPLLQQPIVLGADLWAQTIAVQLVVQAWGDLTDAEWSSCGRLCRSAIGGANARLYRRATISSSMRAVIEVGWEPEPPSTWAVTVTTASLSGEIMQSWP